MPVWKSPGRGAGGLHCRPGLACAVTLIRIKSLQAPPPQNENTFWRAPEAELEAEPAKVTAPCSKGIGEGRGWVPCTQGAESLTSWHLHRAASFPGPASQELGHFITQS